MQAVNVVLARHLRTETSEIFARLGHTGVHHPLVTAQLTEFGTLAGQGAAAQLLADVSLADGKGHNPGVNLEPALVAFVNGELQRVVRGSAPRFAREDAVPRLHIGREHRGAAHAGLEEHGVDACLHVLVKYIGECFALLGRFAFGASGSLWPVEAHNSGQPDSANLSRAGRQLRVVEQVLKIVTAVLGMEDRSGEGGKQKKEREDVFHGLGVWTFGWENGVKERVDGAATKLFAFCRFAVALG